MTSSRILLLCILLLFPVTAIAGIPDRPMHQGYVYDYADVLSASDELLMNDYSETVDKLGAGQVVIVTVKTLDGQSSEDYGLELFNSWEIGSQSKNDGILILLAPNERRIQITLGEGIDDFISNEECGSLINMFSVPYLSQNQFSEGICSLTKAVCIRLCLDRIPMFDSIEMIMLIEALSID